MKALLPIVLLSLTTSAFAQESDTEKKEFKAIFIKSDEKAAPVMQGDHILFEKGMKWHAKGDEKLTAEQKATLMTKQMTLHLSLDQGQERKVGKVNTKHHEQIESLKDLKGFEKRSAHLDAQIEHQRELQKILSEEQFDQFKKMHQNRRGQMHVMPLGASIEKLHELPGLPRMPGIPGMPSLHQGEGEFMFFGDDSDKSFEVIIDGEGDDTDATKNVFVIKTDELHSGDTDASEHKNVRIRMRKDGAGPMHQRMMKGKSNITVMGARLDEQPLIIIDGKEAGEDINLDSLDPNTIESINVLKGPSAEKAYGEKGKNGVVVITLKKK
jgi:TonB-dependent SusC/RagA subfamily outer membrane receptor